MRCPDCNKFVSYDDSYEPEAEIDISDGQISGTVRVVLPCAECGTELKEYSFDIDIDLTDLLADHNQENHADDEDIEDDGFPVDNIELEVEATELTTRTEGAGRWMKTFYGHQTELRVTCTKCDETLFSRSEGDDIQASYMEEMY